jgi:deoxyribodipyrimidine photo-lyase
VTTLVWFRQDLRLADNPALARAANGPVVPVYVFDETLPWSIGAAGRWWLHGSLEALARDLARLGAPLVLRRGAAVPVIDALVRATGAKRVVWNRLYEPAAVARDALMEAGLKSRGIVVESFNAGSLAEPSALDRAYQVFTPFWRALQRRGEPQAAIAAPVSLICGPQADSDALADWALRPSSPDRAAGLRETWAPGEAGAQARLAAFLGQVPRYGRDRDRPDRDGTSLLSPHLRFGEIGPRQIWHAVRAAAPEAESFLRALAWREFSINLLRRFEDMAERPLRASFEAFPWRSDSGQLRAWQRGRTGYPIVDAGMRQLWKIGWMPNRVRMIVASFLVKHLLLPWQVGEKWFWDTLVDADLANNAASWQWVAGSGVDAAPYFRIFNPVAQGERFDPSGAYVKRWVPELARLPAPFVHRPWAAPSSVLRAARIVRDESYPEPIVDHVAARVRALAAFHSLRAHAA